MPLNLTEKIIKLEIQYNILIFFKMHDTKYQFILGIGKKYPQESNTYFVKKSTYGSKLVQNNKEILELWLNDSKSNKRSNRMFKSMMDT